MKKQKSDSTGQSLRQDNDDYSVYRDFLANMQRFIDMLKTIPNRTETDWMTVEEVAAELKISKSIVYRLIRTGELEAVNIVLKNNGINSKGHYRIPRNKLNQYLDRKKVKPICKNRCRPHQSRRFPKVKNYLGL